jgi:hypothetical protein
MLIWRIAGLRAGEVLPDPGARGPSGPVGYHRVAVVVLVKRARDGEHTRDK